MQTAKWIDNIWAKLICMGFISLRLQISAPNQPRCNFQNQSWMGFKVYLSRKERGERKQIGRECEFTLPVMSTGRASASSSCFLSCKCDYSSLTCGSHNLASPLIPPTPTAPTPQNVTLPFFFVRFLLPQP